MVGTAVSMKLDGIATTAFELLLELEFPNAATLVFALLNAVPENAKSFINHRNNYFDSSLKAAFFESAFNFRQRSILCYLLHLKLFAVYRSIPKI